MLEPPTSQVVISEILYHPVKEDSLEDEHEFVELHNSGTAPVSVGGWKLHVGSSDRLTFPQGLIIAADGYLVLAKRRERLLADTRYGLSPEVAIGDFTGGLDNGGGRISILDEQGMLLDSVQYDDDAPWPMGADAFGAQEEWLPEIGPYHDHQYMGRSLERYSPKLPSSDPRNWEASAIDQATPGRANSVSGEPPAIVLKVSALSESAASAAISASDAVRVTALLSAGSVSDVLLEYRLDPVEKIGASTATLPMKLKPGTDATYEATVPKTAENTVVRYRILGSRSGSERERIGPRTTDPRQFYAYFVAPRPTSGRSYHLFITPQNWATLNSNLKGGLSDGCVINPNWDATVPAVFVHDARVYDVQVRYQGSRYRRPDSLEIPNWTAPGPSGMRVYSWRVKFPRYDSFDGFDAINLNKQKQSCPGVLNALEADLLKAAGIPAEIYRFARFYINGGYYNYAMEVRDTEEPVLADFEGQDQAGDLFESDGVSGGDAKEGPWGLGNFTPLPALCSLTPLQRYQFTYERHSHRWKDHTPEGHRELASLIEELDTLVSNRTTDVDPGVVAYFQERFDIPRLITHFAVRNWSGVWDDGTHNFQPYKRISDGKWMVLSHDFDCNFGGNSSCGATQAATLSFYHPETGKGRTWTSPSRLKIELIKSFRTEFAAQVNELGKTLFSEQSMNQRLDRILADFDRPGWLEAPVRGCDLDQRIGDAKKWLAERRTFWAKGVQ